MLPNAKKMNLKVSISPISDLWKRLRMSLGHEFIGKKGKVIKRLSVRILELQCFMFRGRKHFLHLCLQEGCVDNLLVILKQKGGCQ